LAQCHAIVKVTRLPGVEVVGFLPGEPFGLGLKPERTAVAPLVAGDRVG